jgi:hypothetical protein
MIFRFRDRHETVADITYIEVLNKGESMLLHLAGEPTLTVQYDTAKSLTLDYRALVRAMQRDEL